jgi:hypothetical protein
MINIACVFKSKGNPRGADYTIDWVSKLYNSLARNIDIEFQFNCLSDVDTPYNTIPLVLDSVGFWNKLELFRPGLFDGPVLYFDLDVVICKNLTSLINSLPKNQFLMIKEPYRGITNSSIMYWDGDYSYLYTRYCEAKDAIINEYKVGGLRFGDQGFISENVHYEFLEKYMPLNSIGWKHHKVNTTLEDPSIIVFTSTQKPSNNLDLVRPYWY